MSRREPVYAGSIGMVHEPVTLLVLMVPGVLSKASIGLAVPQGLWRGGRGQSGSQ